MIRLRCEIFLPRCHSPRRLSGSRIRTVMATLLFLGLMVSCTGWSQSPKADQDPIPASIRNAYKEWRLADAEALLKTAIHDAETKGPPDPRLHELLSLLANVEGHLSHAEEALEAAKRMLAVDDEAFPAGTRTAVVVMDLSTVAAYYEMTGDDEAAGKAYERSLEMAREAHGNPAVDSLLPIFLFRLAHFYNEKHRNADAKELLMEAVGICNGLDRQRAPSCSESRAELAELYHQEGNFRAAEDIASGSGTLTPDANVDWSARVESLDTLARQYEEEDSYDLAEATYRQAIAVIEKTPGVEDKTSATAVQMLRMGQLFEKEGRVDEAGEIYKKSLSTAEASVTAEHPNRALSLPVFLDPLVALYRKENRLSELETILRQALDLGERSFGPHSANLGGTIQNLAMVCRDEGKYQDAIQFFQRDLQIGEKIDPESPQLPALLLLYADLLQKANQPEEAEAVIKRATALREKLQRKKSATPDQTSKN